MKTINFTKDWNYKLALDYFTTIRPAWDYYQIGDRYTVNLNKKPLLEVMIVEIKRIKLSEINRFVSLLDAALEPEELKANIQKMYPDKNFEIEPLYLLLLKRLE